MFCSRCSAFPINTLSLFGLVLAIGLVVDDAIVVVEAVEHHIDEGMSPKDATFKAMEEISGPVVGIALVLSAVFIPTAFIPGITGRLYQQFAVTIAISVLISAFNALTLSPALSALLLRPRKKSGGLLRRFFDGFNRVFARATAGYLRVTGALIRKSAIAFVVLIACGFLAGLFGSRLPSSFLPDEDQGYMFMNLQLPNASSLQRTEAAAHQIEDLLAKTPGVESTASVIGFSLLSLTRSSYNAFFFVTLKEWKDRTEEGRTVSVHPPEHQPEVCRPGAGHCVLVFAAGDSRRGNFRRLHLRSRGPFGKGRAVSRHQRGQVPGRRAGASGTRHREHHVHP